MPINKCLPNMFPVCSDGGTRRNNDLGRRSIVGWIPVEEVWQRISCITHQLGAKVYAKEPLLTFRHGTGARSFLFLPRLLWTYYRLHFVSTLALILLQQGNPLLQADGTRVSRKAKDTFKFRAPLLAHELEDVEDVRSCETQSVIEDSRVGNSFQRDESGRRRGNKLLLRKRINAGFKPAQTTMKMRNEDILIWVLRAVGGRGRGNQATKLSLVSNFCDGSC